MVMTFKNGDMFSEPVEAVVNTVNCVGVMGKGIALEFKKRWPNNFKAYKKLCDAKQLVPGDVFVFENSKLFASNEPRFLINFPTKDHWRSKSKISFIEEGLDALSRAIVDFNITSIAIPPLGCGNGGLEWSEVKPLIEFKLRNLENVQIVVFPPYEIMETPEHMHADFPMTFERATLLKALGDMALHFDGSLDRISMQKIVYFLQALGIDFKLEFSRNLHGPYSETLKQAFISLEQNGMISGFMTGDRQSCVTPSGYAVAHDFFRRENRSSESVIKRLDLLIQGFENPYGLELLASVHWLAKHERHYPVEEIIQAMRSWTEDKRNRFKDESIRVAYSRLVDDGLLD